MKFPVALLLLGLAPAAACIQQLDTMAASGSAHSVPDDTGLGSSDACPNQFAVGSFNEFICGPPDGANPVLLNGFPIELEDGARAAGPCDSIEQQSLEIRQEYCASCHSPPAKLGGFDFVLDDARLCSAVSSTAKDDAGNPARFVIPGDPDDSRLYHRMVVGEMPPTQTPPLPRASASDFSVLRTWILSCLDRYGGADAASDGGGASEAASMDGGVSDAAGTDGAALEGGSADGASDGG